MPRALKAVEGVSQRARPSEKVGVTLEVVLVLVVELVLVELPDELLDEPVLIPSAVSRHCSCVAEAPANSPAPCVLA